MQCPPTKPGSKFKKFHLVDAAFKILNVFKFNLLNNFYSLILQLGLSLRNSTIKVTTALKKVFIDLFNDVSFIYTNRYIS